MGKLLLFSFILIGVIAVSSLTVLTPVSAKNMNLPDNANKILYYSLGMGYIAVPSNWPVGGLHPATLQIQGVQVVGGSFGEFSVISLALPYQSNWLPVVRLSTSNDYLQFMSIVQSGFPASAPTNSKLLSDDVLKVERHGNQMTIELAADQTVRWGTPSGTYISITIPAFKIELDQLGGSYHADTTSTYTGFAGASGYSLIDSEMGFYGTGALTCATWNYDDHAMTDCTIVMHGIRTFYPPT